MSEVPEFIECPQCGFESMDYIYTYQRAKDVTMCRRCGYYQHRDGKDHKGGDRRDWYKSVRAGNGVLFCRYTGQRAVRGGSCTTGTEALDVERWLRDAINKGEVDPDTSYLTRLNSETDQVEFIVGRFCEWSETELGESEDEDEAPE